MNQTTIEPSQVDLAFPKAAENRAPEPPPQPTIDGKDFSMGFAMGLRILFLDVLSMMRQLATHIGAFTLRQCPSTNPDEIYEKRNRVFETNIIELSAEIKEGESAPASRAIFLIFKCFQPEIAFLVFLLLVEIMSRCSIPFIIEALMQRPEQSWILGLLIFALVFGLILRHNNWRYGGYINVRIRTMLAKTLYKKLMRVGTPLLKSLQLSKLVNLVTSDMNAIELKLQYLFIAFTAPVTLVYCLVLLILWNGEQGVIGFVYFISMFVVHIIINNRLAGLTVKRSALVEQRMKMLKESLDGIKLLKMYTWENTFRNIVCCLKQKQTRVVMFRYLLLLLQRALSLSSAAVSSILIFLTEFYIQGKIGISQVFATLQLFILLRFNVMFFSQTGIDHYFELKEILERFLHIMEIKQKHMVNNLEEEPQEIDDNSEYVAVLRGVSLFWVPDKCVLNNINLQLERGKKYSLMGKVGQGKSTLLQFLLRQVAQYRGAAKITYQISCSQQIPFIFTGTIKQNILFGRPENPVLYRKVLQATCLQQDLQLLEKHDHTEVIDNGENLSGGQKARIGLARGLYQQSDLYVFDDPLSAVDQKVAARIIYNMFSDLLKHKTVVLSTSNSKLLDYFDYHLTLEEETSGTTIVKKRNYQIHISLPFQEQIIQQQIRLNAQNKKKLPAGGQILYQTYLRYAKESGSLFQWIIVLILFIGCEVIFSVYVSELANLYGNSINGTAWAKVLCLSFSLIIIYFLKYLYLVYVLIKANLSLHNKVYEKLLGGTVSFFENTYRSDLISRFSNDISIMDTSLPLIFCDSIESVLYFLNLVIVIAIKVKWWAPSIPFMFIVIGVIYKKCSPILQKSKLLDLKMKAPVIESFTDLIKGATQTRCFRLQNIGFKKIKQRLLASYRTNHLYNCLQRGFGFYIQGGTLVFSILGIILTYFTSWDLSSGQQLIYSIALSDYIQFGIRQISTLDGLMMSVQRILSLENIPQEDQDIQRQDPGAEWPAIGRVQFKNVTLKYDNGKEALKNVSFVIEEGKKTGCLGRTGAGKSSILHALFRYQPIEEGTITIDGININTVPVSRLRNSFGVIPQTPFVFSGTLRQNLDPNNQYTDQQITKLLAMVKMQEHAQQLDAPSLHLTLGQKQLVCLCRCILKNPKILVFDEATSSIDRQTDSLVQDITRMHFANTTIFSIAHRINTISDSHLLLQVSHGSTAMRRIYNSHREMIHLTKKQRVQSDTLDISL